MEKVTTGMRKVLQAIHEGRKHRASCETYQKLCDAKLATYVNGTATIQGRWIVLPAGNELLK